MGARIEMTPSFVRYQAVGRVIGLVAGDINIPSVNRKIAVSPE